MKITILTLFPAMFQGPLTESILKRAQADGKVTIKLVNIRDYGIGKHRIVDDTAYGGGVGMVMRVDVLHKALMDHTGKEKNERVILTSASGTPFTQQKAKELAKLDHLIIICGHYEGIDERIAAFIDEEISIGDFVTTGGELPSMLIADAVTRLIPGVLKEGVTQNESFSLISDSDEKLLEYPQYTKPPIFQKIAVPEVLLSGNHQRIAEWRRDHARKKTARVRPDLLKKRA